jgi:HEPN domain-containing protein
MSEDDDEVTNDAIFVVQRWLLIAHRDVRAAYACVDAADPIPETAAYHCQQSAEKLTKALLVLAGVPFRKTHDMEALRDLAVPHFPGLTNMIDRQIPRRLP